MGSAARLIVLGSGTAVPRADRATSCYLVDDGEGLVLLVDCGPGALHRAAAAGYPLPAIDAVLLTHIHPDHCADLVALQFALRSPLGQPRPRPLLVFGHAAVALLVARLRNAWPEDWQPGATASSCAPSSLGRWCSPARPGPRPFASHTTPRRWAGG